MGGRGDHEPARAEEMVTGMILGFFMNGVYQLVFLFGIGTVIR